MDGMATHSGAVWIKSPISRRFDPRGAEVCGEEGSGGVDGGIRDGGGRRRFIMIPGGVASTYALRLLENKRIH